IHACNRTFLIRKVGKTGPSVSPDLMRMASAPFSPREPLVRRGLSARRAGFQTGRASPPASFRDAPRERKATDAGSALTRKGAASGGETTWTRRRFPQPGQFRHWPSSCDGALMRALQDGQRRERVVGVMSVGLGGHGATGDVAGGKLGAGGTCRALTKNGRA